MEYPAARSAPPEVGAAGRRSSAEALQEEVAMQVLHSSLNGVQHNTANGMEESTSPLAAVGNLRTMRWALREDVTKVVESERSNLQRSLEDWMCRWEDAHEDRMSKWVNDIQGCLGEQHGVMVSKVAELLKEVHFLRHDNPLYRLHSSRDLKAGNHLSGLEIPDGKETSHHFGGHSRSRTEAMQDGNNGTTVTAEHDGNTDWRNKGHIYHGQTELGLEALLKEPNYRQRSASIMLRGHTAEDYNKACGWTTVHCRHQKSFQSIRGGVNCLTRMVISDAFDAVCGSIILLNAIFVGVRSNVYLSALRQGEDYSEAERIFLIVEKIFTSAFVVEWLIRLAAYGNYFFHAKEKRWHVFDTILVIGALFEVLFFQMSSMSMILRITRFVRLIRLIRIVRMVSAFRELRLMIFGLLSSAQSLFWSIVFLGIVMYFFSIIFLMAVHNFAKDHPENAKMDDLLVQFGSVYDAMLSLFMAVSGGQDWLDFYASLAEINLLYGWLFVVYIMVTAYGVLNVMTGIFVESAMLTAKMDRDMLIKDELARKDSYMAQMKEVFREADTDNSGSISWDEFNAHIKDERIQAYFATLELDIAEAQGLFRLLDVDESDNVNIDEFVVGCFRLKGQAKGVDLATLMYENKKMMEKWTRFMSYQEEQFEVLERGLEVLVPKMRSIGRRANEETRQVTGQEENKTQEAPTSKDSSGAKRGGTIGISRSQSISFTKDVLDANSSKARDSSTAPGAGSVDM